MQQAIRFNNVALLAQRLGKHIGLYDLESTTFRGVPQFAITEVYCFFVSPEGKGAAVGSLINPERQISAKAMELTGITPEMTKNQETWAARFATMFHNMAAGECWVAGFNNALFDNRAVMDMNHRYGKPIDAFKYTFDVRTLHLKLSHAKSTAGTLLQVSQMYGVFPKGNLHRAEADVALSVELLDAIIARYGLDTVVQFIESSAVAPVPATQESVPSKAPLATAPKRAARPTPVLAKLVEYVQGKSFVSMKMLEDAFQMEARTLSFEVGKAIDDRVVDPFTFAIAPAQEWITQGLVELDTVTLTQGKLKPIHDALAPTAPEGHLDYVQLRIALLKAGQSWTTLKPS